MNLPEEAAEKLMLRSTEAKFFNTSPMDLSKLGESGIKDNLETYIQSFSRDAREIFEYFKFTKYIAQLGDANLLYKGYRSSPAPTSARSASPITRWVWSSKSS